MFLCIWEIDYVISYILFVCLFYILFINKNKNNYLRREYIIIVECKTEYCSIYLI